MLRVFALTVLMLGALGGCIKIPLETRCDDVDRAGFDLLPGVAATSPSPPLLITFELCDPDAFFIDGSRAIIEVIMNGQPAHVEAGLHLPAWVSHVSGEIEFQGTLGPERSLRLEPVVRADRDGEYTLRAWSELTEWGTNGSRAAPAAEVIVRGDKNGGEILEHQCDEDRSSRSCFPPTPLLELEAEAQNPSTVVGGFVAEVPLHGRASLWSGAQLLGPWQPVPFDLEEGEEFEITNRIQFPDEWVRDEQGCGHYQVMFHVYPHASIDSRIYERSAFFDVEDGKIVVYLDHEPRCPDS